MVLPGSNVSLGLIQGEFGGVTPISLVEYYAGGLYVPSGTSGIPTAGLISFSNFLGKSNVFSLLQGSLIRRYFTTNDTTIQSDTVTMDNGFNNTSSDGGFIHATNFSLPVAFNLGMEYTGWLTVGTTGSYAFGLRSDDGSDFAVWIGGTWYVITSNYGSHAVPPTPPPNPGNITLTAGVAYPIRIRLTQGNGEIGLALDWQTPTNGTWTGVPFSIFSCNGVTPITTTTIRQDFPEPRSTVGLRLRGYAANFDASTLPSTNVIDSEIGSWVNISSLSANPATGQGTSAKPRLRQLNGYYHVQFDRANDNHFSLSSFAFDWLNVGGVYNGYTIFVVAKFTSPGTFERFMDFGNGSANNNIWFGRHETVSALGGDAFNGTTVALNIVNVPFTETGGFHIFAMHVTNTSSGGVGSIYCDSTTALFSKAFSTPLVNRTTTLNYIGKSNWNVDANLNADMRQLLIYKTALSQADLTTVFNDLKTKWGL